MTQRRPDFKLIVGLGNPGAEYSETRHNAGFWLVDRIAEHYGCRFSPDAKSAGDLARVQRGSLDLRLLKPTTFMNRSGVSVLAVCQYFKIEPAELLVVHDELDLPPGSVKLKWAGGHGGHNGLRDIARVIGSDYWRIRVGIGHPGHRDRVSPWVLARPQRADEESIHTAIDRVMSALDGLLGADFAKATQAINTVPST